MARTFRSRTSALLAGALLTATPLALTACGSGVPGDAVAVVAGNPISKAAFDHWIFIAAKGQSAGAPGSPVIVPDPPDYTRCVATARTISALAKTPAATLKKDCSQVFGQLRDQVMDFLVRSYWYQADAHAEGINVTDKQVQTALNTAKSAQFPTNAQFQTFLNQSGQTLQDITYRIRVNQIYKALIKHQSGSITPKAVQAYYSSHSSQFGTPETRNLRLILAKTQSDAQAAYKALSHGGTWEATAAKYSTDPATKTKGGLLTGVTKGQQDAALDKASFSAPAQQLEGPVKGQFGYYVFKVTSIKPGSQQSLAQATPLIKQILTQQQSTNAQTAVDSHAKKQYLGKTSCRSVYAMQDCNGFKAPKPVVTPPVSPSPSGSTTTKK